MWRLRRSVGLHPVYRWMWRMLHKYSKWTVLIAHLADVSKMWRALCIQPRQAPQAQHRRASQCFTPVFSSCCVFINITHVLIMQPTRVLENFPHWKIKLSKSKKSFFSQIKQLHQTSTVREFRHLFTYTWLFQYTKFTQINKIKTLKWNICAVSMTTSLKDKWNITRQTALCPLLISC